MKKPLVFYLIDDDLDVLTLVRFLLEDAGYQVYSSTSSKKAVEEIIAKRPDVVLTDIMMPELDGFEVCKKLREVDELKNTKIIMLTAKTYDFDRRRAHQLGADDYVHKPFITETFVAQIEALIADRMTLTYWGVRGTLPVPGNRALRYGGNTSCVTLSFKDDQFFVFDAGTGIKELSDHLLSQGKLKSSAKIFISHPHWDHINALPFFAPMYIQGGEFEICGPLQGDMTMREMISYQMDSIYFPITIREFGARVYFRNLREEKISYDGTDISTMLLTHPGNCLGYRIKRKDTTVCYVTDNELFLDGAPEFNATQFNKLVSFVQGADILITDTTYSDEEYKTKVGWGHSCASQVARLAHNAGVGTLHLFHHDPSQDDDAIDKKLAQAEKALKELGSSTKCIAPAERDSFTI
ncbi:MAG: response regulator [Nitrospirae bacterium]|nr:response regulator [Nitrospirota bacterium]